MYGDAWVQQYLAIAGGTQADVDAAFKRWNIKWTILSPREPLIRLLDKRPGWRRVYSDHVRRGAGPRRRARRHPATPASRSKPASSVMRLLIYEPALKRVEHELAPFPRSA